ncbi:hypothetical protein MTR67_003310, partial [Solanum verrucosum]
LSLFGQPNFKRVYLPHTSSKINKLGDVGKRILRPLI